MSPSSGQNGPTVGRLSSLQNSRSVGKCGVRRGAQHELLRAKHRVENRERRGGTLARVAVRAEAARCAQVARAVGGAAARRCCRRVRRAHRQFVLLRTRKFQVGAAPVLIISARARMNRLRVRRHAERVVADVSVVAVASTALSAASIACTVHLSRGRLTMAAGLSPLPSVGVERNAVEGDLPEIVTLDGAAG